MQKEIHPKYYPQAEVTCSCGNKFTVGSTSPKLSVEICSQCHPFYTGEERLVDTAGRVKKFQKRAAISSELKAKKVVKKIRVKKQATGKKI
ncbi:MAG: 50S ribosomal protein L31 [Candidatus Parcubacteria bacterium]|nr:50S ribosomal protein L31 [Candidatus Parcubacteria bacterium]